jgi:hypothetical protein
MEVDSLPPSPYTAADLDLVARAELSGSVYTTTHLEQLAMGRLLRERERVLRLVWGSMSGTPSPGLLALTSERMFYLRSPRLLGVLPFPARTRFGIWRREIPYSEISALWLPTQGEGYVVRGRYVLFVAGRTRAHDAEFSFLVKYRRSPTDLPHLLNDLDDLLPPAIIARGRTLHSAAYLLDPDEVVFSRRALSELARALSAEETIHAAVQDGFASFVLTDRRIIRARPHRWFHFRPAVRSIEYRVLRDVEVQAWVQRQPLFGRETKQSRFGLGTDLVVTSNIDEKPIKLVLTGKNHRERAEEIKASISSLRRRDYARRWGREVRDDVENGGRRP